jgi:hypothetical protein
MVDPFGLGLNQFPGSSFGMGPLGSSFGQNSMMANPFSGSFGGNPFGPSSLIGNPVGGIGAFSPMGPNFPGSSFMPPNQFNASPMLGGIGGLGSFGGIGGISQFGSPLLPGFGGNQFNMTGQVPYAQLRQLSVLPTTYTSAPTNLQTGAPQSTYTVAPTATQASGTSVYNLASSTTSTTKQ